MCTIEHSVHFHELQKVEHGEKKMLYQDDYNAQLKTIYERIL